MAPEPVPTSTMKPLRRRGAGEKAVCGVERDFDEGLGLGPRDEDGGCDEEVEAVELAVAGDVGGGLVGQAAGEVGVVAGSGGRRE